MQSVKPKSDQFSPLPQTCQYPLLTQSEGQTYFCDLQVPLATLPLPPSVSLAVL